MKKTLYLTLLSLVIPALHAMDLTQNPAPTACDTAKYLEQVKKHIAENPQSALAQFVQREKDAVLAETKKIEEARKNGEHVEL